MIVTTNTTCNWRLKDNPNYVFGDNRCFNSKTGREIKQVYNNGCIGYNIQGKFKSLTSLRKQLEIIPKEYCPF